MKLLSAKNIWMEEALASIRILVGLMMTYHGLEVFDSTIMNGYAQWETIKTFPFPDYIAYVGKGLEFVTGLCFVFGFLTRVAAILMAVNMLFICFFIGKGRFYYEDQHSFLFAVLALVFFFTGPMKWAVDFQFFKEK